MLGKINISFTSQMYPKIRCIGQGLLFKIVLTHVVECVYSSVRLHKDFKLFLRKTQLKTQLSCTNFAKDLPPAKSLRVNAAVNFHGYLRGSLGSISKGIDENS